MEKGNKLTITVSGKIMSGKSRLSFLLKKFLRENGFDVEHEISLDYHNESDFNSRMSRGFDDVIKNVKDNTQIVIKEEQTGL